MTFYKWDKSLATGVGEIDVQHQMIFAVINDFMEDSLSSKGKNAIKPVIDFLGEYVVKHFALEEKYMTTYSYPEYPFHKSQHTDFQQDFAKLRGQFEAEGATPQLIEAFKQRVCEWLKGHIMVVDKALAGFLKPKIYPGFAKTLNTTPEG
jgi:hemerythrin